MKHKPATPLPWMVDGSPVSGTPYIRAGVQGSMVTVAHYKAGMSKPDAAYIVHAANSYPRLVEALAHIATGGEDWKDCARKARALLRELGED